MPHPAQLPYMGQNPAMGPMRGPVMGPAMDPSMRHYMGPMARPYGYMSRPMMGPPNYMGGPPGQMPAHPMPWGGYMPPRPAAMWGPPGTHPVSPAGPRLPPAVSAAMVGGTAAASVTHQTKPDTTPAPMEVEMEPAIPGSDSTVNLQPSETADSQTTLVPSVMAPAAVAPSAVAPSSEAPSVVAPSAEAPSAEAPSAGALSAIAPSDETSSAIFPSAEALSVIAPSTEAPSADTLSAVAPQSVDSLNSAPVASEPQYPSQTDAGADSTNIAEGLTYDQPADDLGQSAVTADMSAVTEETDAHQEAAPLSIRNNDDIEAVTVDSVQMSTDFIQTAATAESGDNSAHADTLSNPHAPAESYDSTADCFTSTTSSSATATAAGSNMHTDIPIWEAVSDNAAVGAAASTPADAGMLQQ